MVDMVDKTGKGGVDIEDFIGLMRELGLITKKKEKISFQELEESLVNKMDGNMKEKDMKDTIDGPYNSKAGLQSGTTEIKGEEAGVSN